MEGKSKLKTDVSKDTNADLLNQVRDRYKQNGKWAETIHREDKVELKVIQEFSRICYQEILRVFLRTTRNMENVFFPNEILEDGYTDPSSLIQKLVKKYLLDNYSRFHDQLEFFYLDVIGLREKITAQIEIMTRVTERIMSFIDQQMKCLWAFQILAKVNMNLDFGDYVLLPAIWSSYHIKMADFVFLSEKQIVDDESFLAKAYHHRFIDVPRYPLTGRPMTNISGLCKRVLDKCPDLSRARLPVSRYQHLYYGAHEEYKDLTSMEAQRQKTSEGHCGTYYFIEPHSRVLLDLGKVAIYASKVHAYLVMALELNLLDVYRSEDMVAFTDKLGEGNSDALNERDLFWIKFNSIWLKD